MVDDSRAGLSGLTFVNPHRPGAGGPAWTHIGVPARDPVPLPSRPRPLDVEIAGAGRIRGLDAWLAETYSTSLVVVDRGTVVHEWYADGVDPSDLFLGASMTKSVLAHLAGVAIGRGALRLDEAVTARVPELIGSGYDGCTVEHLLTMTTGVDWVEDHRDPASRASRLLRCFSDGAGASRDLLRSVPSHVPPGTQFEYCTGDSQVLDWVRERATGATYPEALAELWAMLGCTDEAVVGTDMPGGVALAGGGLAATARDWARIGMLQLDGTAGGARLLDPGWVDASSVPSRPFLAPGRLPSGITTHAGFGYHWWPVDEAGRRVTADGSRGQFTYADRDLGVVVVKTSRWPYDDWLTDRQLRDLSYLGLPCVARATADTRPNQTTTPSNDQEVLR